MGHDNNRSLNRNKQYKEKIGHDNNTLWDQILANQSIKSIKIGNIDSNYMKRYCF